MVLEEAAGVELDVVEVADGLGLGVDNAGEEDIGLGLGGEDETRPL